MSHSPTEKTIQHVSRITNSDEFARMFASVEFKQKAMKGLRIIPTNPATYAVRNELSDPLEG